MVDLEVLGLQLDSNDLKVFYNLNDAMILPLLKNKHRDF